MSEIRTTGALIDAALAAAQAAAGSDWERLRPALERALEHNSDRLHGLMNRVVRGETSRSEARIELDGLVADVRAAVEADPDIAVAVATRAIDAAHNVILGVMATAQADMEDVEEANGGGGSRSHDDND